MKSFKQHSISEAFTRQHYVAIAKVIKDIDADAYKTAHKGLALNDEGDFIEGANWAAERIATKLAETFKDDNPRFDKGFFLNACGL